MYASDKKPVCGDCHFTALGEEIENSPVGHPRMIRYDKNTDYKKD